MPARNFPIIKDEIYHIFNRSVARQPIFLTTKDYQRGLDVLNFYLYENPTLRFSHYNRLIPSLKTNFLENLKSKNPKLIKLLSFCLMPNHFHFLIKEIKERGIMRFTSNFQNSYAKYVNVRTERNGALFQSRFKAVRIESEEQLVHVCRYIHLNPFSSFIIKNINELKNYKWSSFIDYLNEGESETIDKNEIMPYFSSIEDFQRFTFDQADYQRTLDVVKHLVLE